MIERKFGRLREFNELSRNFPVRQFVRGLEPKTQYWECSKVLDQKSSPKCVGYSFAHELIAVPVPVLTITDEDAHRFYQGAQDHDQWPGDSYDGSSVLGVAKYAMKEGWCDGVYWAFSHMDWKLGLSYRGPAIIGISWMTGMMEPNSEGFVRATGQNEGGHAILLNGWNEERKFWTIHNSWGKENYGINGEAYISDDDMNYLRQDNAECVFLEGRHDISGKPGPDPGQEPNNGKCKSKFSRWL